MRTRSAMGATAAVLLLATACGGERASNGQAEATPGDEPAPATTAPVRPPSHDDAGARFSPALFGPDSATIDNPWFPHTPGTQFTYEGHAVAGGETTQRRIVSTVTDVTKEVAGVRALVVWERDYDEDVMVEGELSFNAQDKDGNVWHLGEYRETFEDEEFVGGRVWVAGDPEGAQAGILMPADPKPGDPSFSEGYAPPPWNWDDHGRARETADQTCVKAGCFPDVLVVEEFEPSVPDAFQLKYHARDVGNVRVGWDGSNEPEREELELVERTELTPDELTKARDAVLAMEDRGDAYGRLGPVQPVDGPR